MKAHVAVLLAILLGFVLLSGVLNAVSQEVIPGSIDRQESPVSQQIEDIQLLKQLGGSTEAVAQQGDYVYLGMGPRLVVLDVQDPAQPVFMGQTSVLSGVVSHVTVAGDYAYISAGGDLAIVYVGNPQVPVQVGSYEVTGRIEAVVIDGDYAYVAEAKAYVGSDTVGGGLYAFDVSDPTTPLQVGYYGTADSVTSVALNGDYVYAIVQLSDDYGTLLVMDVSEPALLAPINSVPVPSTNAAAILDDTLYLAVGEHGLGIYDVMEPVTPTLVSYDSGPFTAYDVDVVDDYAYVAGSTGGLRIFDVSEPQNMVEVGVYDLPGLVRTRAVAATPEYVYAAYFDLGLHVISVTNPFSPSASSTYNVLGYAQYVANADNHLYVSDLDEGLRIMDTAMPTEPTEVGFYDPGPGSWLAQIAVLDEHLYVERGGTLGNAEIRTINVLTPTAPSEVSAFKCFTPPILGDAYGDYVAIAQGIDGLCIVDVSDPAVPSQAGVFTDGIDYLADVVISGTLAYLADGRNGLRIVSLADPSNPSETGEVDVGYADSVEVGGGYVYVADSETLHVVDVTNPLSPTTVISQVVTDQPIRSMHLSGNRVYLTDRDHGLRVIDVSQPFSLTTAFSVTLPGRWVWNVVAEDPHIYAANGDAGLLIYGPPAVQNVSDLIAMNDGPTELDDVTTLIASVTEGTNVNYVWDFGDGEGGDGPAVSHVYPMPGVYTAVVTATNSAGSLTAATAVTITEPVTPISGLAAVNDGPTILGNATTFTASVTAGSDVSYQWHFGDGEAANGAVVTHPYTAEGTYTAAVTATNNVNSLTATTIVTIIDATDEPTEYTYLPVVINKPMP